MNKYILNTSAKLVSVFSLYIPDLDITVKEYIFLQIIDTSLITISFNFTLIGGITELVTGKDGSKTAIELDGISNYIDYSSSDKGCLWKPMDCKLGLTVSFSLKILMVKEEMYIFTSGADQVDGYGVAMYIRNSRFYCTVSTDVMEWTVYTTAYKLNTFMSVQFSWSVQSGLMLYFDGEIVAQTKIFISRSVTVSAYSKFYIGKSIKADIYANIVIEGWMVKYAAKETADAVLTVTTESSTTESTTGMLSIHLATMQLCLFIWLTGQGYFVKY